METLMPLLSTIAIVWNGWRVNLKWIILINSLLRIDEWNGCCVVVSLRQKSETNRRLLLRNFRVFWQSKLICMFNTCIHVGNFVEYFILIRRCNGHWARPIPLEIHPAERDSRQSCGYEKYTFAEATNEGPQLMAIGIGVACAAAANMATSQICKGRTIISFAFETKQKWNQMITEMAQCVSGENMHRGKME